MASDSALSFILGVTVVETRATCNNNAPSLRFKKCKLRRFTAFAYRLYCAYADATRSRHWVAFNPMSPGLLNPRRTKKTRQIIRLSKENFV